MSEVRKTLREHSKVYYTSDSDGNPTLEQINCGSLQRIADACGAMAKRHIELISERDYYYQMYKNAISDKEALQRSNASLRGQITKLKKRLSSER